MTEEWKPIKGYEELYAVSNLGNVKSLHYHNKNNGEQLLKQGLDKCGYKVVYLSKGNKQKTLKVHRLVAQAFIPNPENKALIDHIDTNRINNVVTNLRWVTDKENANNPLTKQHLSSSFKGRIHSEETKIKISLSNPNKKPVLQYSLDEIFIKEWISIKEAARQLGLNPSGIRQCCKGGYKKHGNFIWKYKEDI